MSKTSKVNPYYEQEMEGELAFRRVRGVEFMVLEKASAGWWKSRDGRWVARELGTRQAWEKGCDVILKDKLTGETYGASCLGEVDAALVKFYKEEL